MSDTLHNEWEKLRAVRWWFAGILALATVIAAIAFFAGVAVGAVAFPLREHLTSPSNIVFYPLSTERGPHLGANTLALLTTASFVFVVGLIFLCVWTAFALLLANLMSRRRSA